MAEEEMDDEQLKVIAEDEENVKNDENEDEEMVKEEWDEMEEQDEMMEEYESEFSKEEEVEERGQEYVVDEMQDPSLADAELKSLTSNKLQKLVDIEYFVSNEYRVRISGDFTMRTGTLGTGYDTIPEIHEEEMKQDIMDEEGLEEEMEEEIKEDEHEKKERLIAKYTALMEERSELKRKNSLLHSRVLIYFQRRKFAIPSEDAVDISVQQEYDKLLTKLQQRIMISTKRKGIEANFTKEAIERTDYASLEMTDALQEFVQREEDLADKAVYHSQMVQEKVHHLLSLQSEKYAEVGELRLACIRIRYKLIREEARLKRIESLGANLRLDDYEQLLLEQLNAGEKAEERDDAIYKEREHSSKIISIVTHLREKVYVDSQIIKQKEADLHQAEQYLSQLREEVNKLKIERDKYRLEYERTFKKTGLLTQTSLLNDFEKTVHLVNEAKENVKFMKNSYITDKEEYDAIDDFIKEYKEQNMSFKSSL